MKNYRVPADTGLIVSPIKSTSHKKTTTDSRVKNHLYLNRRTSWSWLCTASRQKGKALQVSLAILFLSGVTKSNKIKLSNHFLKALGVDRYAKYRALRTLEAAGLITVERGSGRSPQITLLGSRPTKRKQ